MNPHNFLSPRAWVALLPAQTQEVVKAVARKVRARVFSLVYSYGPVELEAKLRTMGIKQGDSLVLQSAFSHLNGFSGEAIDIINCILDILGPDGNLFMVSMPYGGSAREYLQQGKPFNVRRTPSHMGLVSELFRRKRGVLRSGNPMHPVLATGPRAAWLIAGHEDLAYSCGENSPFERMLELDTKALMFDVDLDVLTFMHYLEHKFRASAPVEVYTREPIGGTIIDPDGVQKHFAIYAFAGEAMKLRNFGVVYDEMMRRNLVRAGRVGNTNLQVLRLRDVLACGEDLIAQGGHIFAHPGEPTHIKPLRSSGRTMKARKRRD